MERAVFLASGKCEGKKISATPIQLYGSKEDALLTICVGET